MRVGLLIFGLEVSLGLEADTKGGFLGVLKGQTGPQKNQVSSFLDESDESEDSESSYLQRGNGGFFDVLRTQTRGQINTQSSSDDDGSSLLQSDSESSDEPTDLESSLLQSDSDEESGSDESEESEESFLQVSEESDESEESESASEESEESFLQLSDESEESEESDESEESFLELHKFELPKPKSFKNIPKFHRVDAMLALGGGFLQESGNMIDVVQSEEDLEKKALSEIELIGHKIDGKLNELKLIRQDEENFEHARATDLEKLKQKKLELQKNVELLRSEVDSTRANARLIHRMIEELDDTLSRSNIISGVPPVQPPIATLSTRQEEAIRRGELDPQLLKLMCPLACDPLYCDNTPEDETHCYKLLENSRGQLDQVCEPFSDLKNYVCPETYRRCAIAAPYKDHQVVIRHGDSATVAVRGRNLNACMRLYVVPETETCAPEKVAEEIAESVFVMGKGSGVSFPHIEKVDGEEMATFYNISVRREGDYKMCIAQFALTEVEDGEGQGENSNMSVRVLASDQIGVVKQPKENKSSGWTAVLSIVSLVVLLF